MASTNKFFDFDWDEDMIEQYTYNSEPSALAHVIAPPNPNEKRQSAINKSRSEKSKKAAAAHAASHPAADPSKSKRKQALKDGSLEW
ncbi:hypothetical protein ScalyP_jg1173 [Parmales sp. scaly parma]|nr:hypothetical protein ScalyP_jg1173 [Parmales sp. scaly parma]